MAAAGLAEVCPGDAQPLVLARGGEHPLEHVAVGGLELGALGEGAACVGDPACEDVTDLLQLTEADQTRPPAVDGNSRIDGEAREGLRGKMVQLLLEAADLAPQLGAGQTLVAIDASR